MPRDRTGDLVNSGERTPGEVVSGWSDSIVETGIPFSRVYDPAEELARIRRQTYPRPAGMSARARTVAFNSNRSLRRI